MLASWTPAWRTLAIPQICRTRRSARYLSVTARKPVAPPIAQPPPSSMPEKVRLLKLPRNALPTSIYTSQVPNHLRLANRLFRLSLRPLSRGCVRNVNIGPSWLRGDYPAGILPARHERRRPINGVVRQQTGWREATPGEDLEYKMSVESLTLKKPLLVHGRDVDKVDPSGELWWPVLGVVSIKGIDKRAVYRNRAKTRTLAAFQQAIQDFAHSLPRYARNGDLYAYVFHPTPAVLTASSSDLQSAMQLTLTNLSKMHQKDHRRAGYFDSGALSQTSRLIGKTN